MNYKEEKIKINSNPYIYANISTLEIYIESLREYFKSGKTNLTKYVELMFLEDCFGRISKQLKNKTTRNLSELNRVYKTSLNEFIVEKLINKTEIVKSFERYTDENGFKEEFFENGFEQREELFELVNTEKEYTSEEELKIKVDLIPAFLKYEVQEIVSRNYGNDWTSYLNNVAIYFRTMTFEKLTLINQYEKDKSFFNNSTSKEKKKMRREIFGIISHCSVLLKLVGHNRSWYCCKSLISEYKQKVRKERDFIESRSVIGEDGKEFPLKKCVASKEQKIAEKLNQIDALQKIALKQDWTVVVGLVEGKPYEIFVLKGIDNHTFPSKIEKGHITKIKSKHYELTGSIGDKTYKVDNIIELMSIDERVDTRKYSSMLRHRMHPKHIINQIEEFATIVSFDKVVQRVLRNYVIEKEEDRIKCPSCGSSNYYSEEGCWKCPDCNFSKCG